MEPTPRYSTDHDLLAIVDENDAVIGSKTRREIHQQALRHRSVHILVFDSLGRVCLQKRSIFKDVNPGAWDTSVAGHVDFGETYLQAALRELSEELGVNQPESLTPIGRIDASEGNGWEFVEIFAIRHLGQLTPNLDEIETLEWISREDLELRINAQDTKLTGSFICVWEKFISSALSKAFLAQDAE